MSKKIKILIIDDEQGIRNSLSEILIDEGYETLLADNAKAAKKIISDGHSFDLILLDIWMPDIDGITLLKELKTINHISQPIIMMSGHGTIDTAIDATKNGAYDFIEKPISLHKVLKVINQAINESLEFPAMTIDFLKKQDNQNIISIYNQLIKKKNKLILKTIYTDAVYSMLFELYKSNIYNIDQAQLRKVDDCDLFLEEKKNSTLIFEKILDFNSNTLSIFKIIESKLAKYNIKGVIVENTDLSDKNIEINLDNYELIDFKIFTKSDEDQLIKYSKQILNYYLDSVSNKIYKE
ncbi:MAG: response regulator, partial [Methylophilaceae bacterium]